MNKNITFEDIKEYFINLTGGKTKKVQIENIVINEINFVDNSKECLHSTFAYESFTFITNLFTILGIASAAYLVAFV